MKILLALHGMRPEFTGGCEIYVGRLAGALISRGHDCSILCGTREGAPGITESRWQGIPVYRIRRSDTFVDRWLDSYSPFAEACIDRFLEEHHFDVVHIHHWKRLTCNLGRICSAHGIPCVLTLHDLWTTCPREDRLLPEGLCEEVAGSPACATCVPRHWWEEPSEVKRSIELNLAMLRSELELASRIIVPSLSHARALTRLFGSEFSDYEVLPSLVDEARFANASSTAAGADTDQVGGLRIGYLGHLVEFKGPHLLLEAVGRLDDPEAVEVHLFGEEGPAPYVAKLRRLGNRIGARFHGAYDIKDVASANLDLVVIPSLCHESYGLVLDEVLLLGIPVVVSNRGALPERSAGVGSTFEAGDAEDLRDRLQEVLRDRGLLQRWRSALPRPLPGVDDHVRKLLDLYRSARHPDSDSVGSLAPYRDLLELSHDALHRRHQTLARLYEDAGRVENLEANLERYREVNRAIDRERREQGQVIRELQTDLEGHRAVLAEERRRGEALDRTVQDLRADLQGHRDVLAARDREIRDRRETEEILQRDLRGHRTVLAELRAQRESIEVDLRRLMETSRQSESDVIRLRAELERARDRLRTVERDFIDFRTLHASEVGEQARKIEELQADLDRIRSTFAYRVYRALRGRNDARTRDEAVGG